MDKYKTPTNEPIDLNLCKKMLVGNEVNSRPHRFSTLITFASKSNAIIIIHTGSVA